MTTDKEAGIAATEALDRALTTLGDDDPFVPPTPDPFKRDAAGRIKIDNTPGKMIPAAFPGSVASSLSSPVRGYEHLERILKLAFNQSATGKGRERHSFSAVGFTPWDQQPIIANARQVGPGGPANQVMKKAQEAVTMAGNKNFDGAKAEALGAIVYAAAMFKIFEEMEAASK